MIKLNCPCCKLGLEVPDEALGAKARCDRCEAKFIIGLLPEEMIVLEQASYAADMALLQDKKKSKPKKIKTKTLNKKSPSGTKVHHKKISSVRPKKKVQKKPVVFLWMFTLILLGCLASVFAKRSTAGEIISSSELATEKLPVILKLASVAESDELKPFSQALSEVSPFEKALTSTVDQSEAIIDDKWHQNYTKNGENFENESVTRNGVKVLTVRCGSSENLNKTRLLFHVNKRAKKGDVLKLSFFIRSLKKDSIYGMIETKIDDQKLMTQLTGEWQHVQLPVKLSKNFHDDKGRVAIALGGQEHHFELAKMRLTYFAKNISLASLPKSKFVFKPMSEQEQHEADERIEKIRKGDFTLAFVDSADQSLTAAQIEITQLEHAFPFGSAISTLVFAREITHQEREQYFKYFEENFNKAVFENAMKWRSEDYKENAHTEKILSFLEAKNIPYRGHVFTWPSFKKSPAYLQALKDKPALLQQEILDHIKEFSRRWPKITDWDVLNEPFTNHDLMDCLPKGSASKWFEQARSSLSDEVSLCINDYGILNSYNTKHRDHYFDFTKNLIAEGAPLDSIGFQSHFKYAQEASIIKQRLDSFAALGKTLKITEFDLPAEHDDEQLQAQFLYDFLTLSFSHPSVNEFIMWGFWDKRHWREKCGLYRVDWSLRPQGKVWQELTQKKWRSHAKVKTNSSGKVQGRFFFGKYSVRVTTQEGEIFEQEIQLLHDGSSSKIIKQN